MFLLIYWPPDALKIVTEAGVAAGTLLLAFYTRQSVVTAAKSVNIATQSLSIDEMRDRRHATIDLFFRYDSVEVGGVERMSAHAAASRLLEWLPRLDIMNARKKHYFEQQKQFQEQKLFDPQLRRGLSSMMSQWNILNIIRLFR